MSKAFIVKGKESRVEYGHPWIFKSDISHTTGDIYPGDIVDVYSFKNKFLGRGYINPKSQITIRMLTYEQEEIRATDSTNRKRFPCAVSQGSAPWLMVG